MKMEELIARAVKEELGRQLQPPLSEPFDWLAFNGAVLSALKEGGYTVVPREPTEAMIEAADDAAEEHIQPIHDDLALLGPDGPAAIWSAMIAQAESDQ